METFLSYNFKKEGNTYNIILIWRKEDIFKKNMGRYIPKCQELTYLSSGIGGILLFIFLYYCSSFKIVYSEHVLFLSPKRQ